MNSRLTSLASAILCFAFCGTALAADPAPPAEDPLRATTLKLIELLVEQGVLTREKADALIKQANQTPANPAPAPVAQPASPPGTVRVPYVPQFVRDELKEEIHQELVEQAKTEGWAPPGGVPDWVRHMKWEGDLRVRFEHDSFADGNAPQLNVQATNTSRILTLADTTTSIDRERVRARFGFSDELDDTTSVAVRISTASTGYPLSEMQTNGNNEAYYPVALDRAYIKYVPTDWSSITAGRFDNPFLSTDLVWAGSISFDGVLLKFSPKLGADTGVYLTEMMSPVQNTTLAAHNKYLFATQGGIDQAFGNDTHAKLGLAYYRYVGIEGVVSPFGSTLYNYTAPEITQQGNTYYDISSNPSAPLFGLASSYHLVDLVASLDTKTMGPYHTIVTADFVRNVAFNADAVAERVGTFVAPKVNGYSLKLAFGNPQIQALNDWQVSATYKYVEGDAVLDAFTDQDFHMGGTNAKGYIVGLLYGLGRNSWLDLRYFTSDAITGAPYSVDTVMLDFNARF